MSRKISQNSQENTCARDSFLIKLQASGRCCRCFPVNFAKFLRTPFLTEHLRWLLLFCLSTLLFFLPALSKFFFFFQRALYYFIGRIFFRRKSPGGVLQKSCLKYLVKFIRKHLYRSLFFQ